MINLKTYYIDKYIHSILKQQISYVSGNDIFKWKIRAENECTLINIPFLHDDIMHSPVAAW